jgi:hypothetical protein
MKNNNPANKSLVIVPKNKATQPSGAKPPITEVCVSQETLRHLGKRPIPQVGAKPDAKRLNNPK